MYRQRLIGQAGQTRKTHCCSDTMDGFHHYPETDKRCRARDVGAQKPPKKQRRLTKQRKMALSLVSFWFVRSAQAKVPDSNECAEALGLAGRGCARCCAHARPLACQSTEMTCCTHPESHYQEPCNISGLLEPTRFHPCCYRKSMLAEDQTDDAAKFGGESGTC